jgi:uncharacterized repeat protein (TIGR03803 family)
LYQILEDLSSMRATPVRDQAGNLYGTTAFGGETGCNYGCGVAFGLDVAGEYRVLHSFTGGADGSQPEVGVTLSATGNLYGITTYGGATGGGVLYELTLTKAAGRLP